MSRDEFPPYYLPQIPDGVSTEEWMASLPRHVYKPACLNCGQNDAGEDGWCDSCVRVQANVYGGEETAKLLVYYLENVNVIVDSATVIPSERAEYERKYGAGRQYLVSEEKIYQTARRLFHKAISFTGARE